MSMRVRVPMHMRPRIHHRYIDCRANALGIVGRQIDGMDTDGEDLSALAAKIRQGNGTPEDHALLLARVRATLAESNPRALR